MEIVGELVVLLLELLLTSINATANEFKDKGKSNITRPNENDTEHKLGKNKFNACNDICFIGIRKNLRLNKYNIICKRT